MFQEWKTKAWLRIVEERSRLTLHTHMLILLYGHSKIEYQLNNAVECDNQQHQAEDVIAHPIIEADKVSLFHNFMIKNNILEYFFIMTGNRGKNEKEVSSR